MNVPIDAAKFNRPSHSVGVHCVPLKPAKYL